MSRKRALLNDALDVFKGLKTMVNTVAVLEADSNYAREQLLKDESNLFWRRTFIRCLFAQVEAVIWNQKQLAFNVAKVTGVNLEPKEIEILREEKLVPKDGGTVVRPSFPRFRENLRQMLLLFAKVHRDCYSPMFDKGFDAFCNGYEIRNRLMHPKRTQDPAVSDKDMEMIDAACIWFMSNYDGLMKASRRVVGELAPELKAKLM